MKRSPVLSWMYRLLALIALGLPATAVVPVYAQGTPTVPPTRPSIVAVQADGSEVIGSFLESCLPQPRPGAQECTFAEVPDQLSPLTASTGSKLIFKVDPIDPPPLSLIAQFAPVADDLVKAPELDLLPAKGEFAVSMAVGNYTVQVIAAYPNPSGGEYYVKAGFDLTVTAADPSATSAVTVAATVAATDAATSAATADLIGVVTATPDVAAPTVATSSVSTTEASTTVPIAPAATATVDASVVPATATVASETATPVNIVTESATPIVAVASATPDAAGPTLDLTVGFVDLTATAIANRATEIIAAVTQTAAAQANVTLAPSASPTALPPTATNTETATPTATATATLTATATATFTATFTPTATATSTATFTPTLTPTATNIAPDHVVRVGGREFYPIRFTVLTTNTNGDSVQISRPNPRGSFRIVAAPKDTAQIAFSGPRPETLTVKLLSADGTAIITEQPLPPDNLTLYTLPTQPGNYVLEIRVSYGNQVSTYFYRLQVGS